VVERERREGQAVALGGAHRRRGLGRDEALSAIEEAVDVRRRMAGANRAAYQPVLAMSLNNLPNRLREAGRRHDAEQVRAEALDAESRVNRRRTGPFL